MAVGSRSSHVLQINCSPTKDNKKPIHFLGITGFGITWERFFYWCASLFTFYHFIGFVGGYYSLNGIGYEIGNRRRFISVLRLELWMIWLTVPIYLHLFSFFHALPKDNNNVTGRIRWRRQLDLLRRKCFFILAIVMFLAHATYMYFFLPFNVPYIIYWPSALCLGLWMHLFFFSMAFLCGNAFVEGLIYFQRGREFVSALCRIKLFKLLITDRQFQVVTTLILTVFLSTVQWYASDKVVIKKLEMRLPHYPEDAKPLNVALLTDLHGGSMVFRDQISNVVNLTNSISKKTGKPLDAVFIVGDLIDAPRDLIEQRMEPLRHLKSTFGTFVVSGNHEYYYGNYDEWRQLYKDYGFKLLHNEAVKISDSICLVGLDDISAEKSGIQDEAMNPTVLSKCPYNMSTIVLEHNPAGAKKILATTKVMNRSVDAILSGHTHGGQYYILVPYVYWLLPYLYGEYELNDGATQLFVSAGTLYQAAPMKMVGRSEIWHITFTGITDQ